ncbi:pyocin immunity protein [Escherichia coli]|nr:pyocin immunity protein [Escherichia coli]
MSMNINRLIKYIGGSYPELINNSVITYKTEPKGYAGSPNLNLEMAKEGVFLSFRRDGKIFNEMPLYIQHDKVENWIFPNELPLPLQSKMSHKWVHETFGLPDKSIPPRMIGITMFGWVERFSIGGFHIPVTMRVAYDSDELVKSITYMPTSELRW